MRGSAGAARRCRSKEGARGKELGSAHPVQGRAQAHGRAPHWARMTVQLVYATFPDRATAERLARAMLEQRLAACATFWEAGSLYWWEGAIESADEALALFKTTRAQADGLIEALAQAHPYDVPCIVRVESSGCFPGYGQWVGAEATGTP